MTLLRWLQRWWWARQRATDLRILWPICKEQAGNLDLAHHAFMQHAIMDPCWVREYEDRLWQEVRKLR